jgi:hypothetical protein
MVVCTLQSLVLRGVSVVCDGQSVGLRLGAESQAAWPTTEIRTNPRHPSRNRERGFSPAQRIDDHAEYDRMAASAASGAGRSLRRDGVLSRRSRASSAGSAIPTGWRKPEGTPKSMTAKRLLTTSKRMPAGPRPLASTWAS